MKAHGEKKKNNIIAKLNRSIIKTYIYIYIYIKEKVQEPQ